MAKRTEPTAPLTDEQIQENLKEFEHVFPSSVEKVEKETPTIEIDKTLKPGQVYVVPVDKEGNELREQGFITSERQFKVSYQQVGYIIKKKYQ